MWEGGEGGRKLDEREGALYKLQVRRIRDLGVWGLRLHRAFMGEVFWVTGSTLEAVTGAPCVCVCGGGGVWPGMARGQAGRVQAAGVVLGA